jgi:hypothetical protein
MIELPEEITSSDAPNVRDLVCLSIPKMGKTSILGDFTKQFNALVIDLERGGYEYVDARKVSIYPTGQEDLYTAYKNYVSLRNLLMNNKGKYDYLIIDGLSDLDVLSEIGGTLAYMNTVLGQKFNKKNGQKDGEAYEYGDPNFKLVTTLPDGAGYRYTREWFLNQIEMFRQIAPYRIYAAHIADKLVKDNGKEEVTGSEISLTGKLKTIFAAKVTALAKLVADGDKRYLNFDVLNDSIIAGSRHPKLQGKILISEKIDGKIKTYWNQIYK